MRLLTKQQEREYNNRLFCKNNEIQRLNHQIDNLLGDHRFKNMQLRFISSKLNEVENRRRVSLIFHLELILNIKHQLF